MAADEQDAQTTGPSRLQKWEGVAEAAPTGLNNTIVNTAPGETRSLSERAQKWYTGASSTSTENGLNTAFYEKFMNQQNAAAENGTLSTFFDQKDATGIVTYDHRGHRFGDVYKDGERVGNIYDTYDEDAADLIMADLTMSATQKAAAFEAGGTAVHDEVWRQKAETEKQAGAYLTQQDYQQDVQERVEDITDSAADEWLGLGGGIAGGAAVGAGIGSFFTPIGTAIGGVIGGIVGGIGGWMNRDEMTNTLASSMEKAERAENPIAAFGEYAAGWGALGMQTLQPTTNVTKGLYDALADGGNGTVGDGVVEYYEVDPTTGEAQRPEWLKWTVVGTSLLDSVGLVGAGGAQAFSATMMATIGGDVTSLLASGGYEFNDRSGTFENVLRDEETGELTPGRTLAAAGNIGIDALQMFTVKGLGGAARGANRAVGLGGEAAESTLRSGQAKDIGYNVLERAIGRVAPNSFTGRAIKEGHEIVQEGGFLYAVDKATGKAVSRKMTVGIAAPSEMVGAANISLKARMRAKTAGVKISEDDFYRAAQDLAAGTSRATTMLVNGFGEGMEEGVQAMLEPAQFGETAELGEIWDSSVMGFAMGAGMGLGTTIRGGNADRRMYAQYVFGQQLTQGTDTPNVQEYSEWRKRSQFEKSESIILSQVDRGVSEMTATKLQQDLQHSVIGSTPEFRKAATAAIAMRDMANKSINTSQDLAFVISAADDANVPGYVAGVGHGSMHNLLRAFWEGNRDKIANLRAIDPAEITPEQTAMLEHFVLVDEQAKILDVVLGQARERIAALQKLARSENPGTARADLTAHIEGVNALLMEAFRNEDGQQVLDPATGAMIEGELTPAQRLARRDAVTILQGRHPIGYQGSFAVMVPQMNETLVNFGGEHGVQMPLSIIQSMGADFDGDKIMSLSRLMLDPARMDQIRHGKHLLTSDGKANIGTHSAEAEITRLYGDALTGTGVLATHAADSIEDIQRQVSSLFGMKPQDIQTQIDAFTRRLGAAEPEAANMFVNDMLTKFGDRILGWSERTGLPGLLELDRVVQRSYDKFQTLYALQIDKEHLSSAALAEYVPQDTSYARVLGQRAATDGQTAGIVVESNDMFRTIQSLKYIFDESQTVGQLSETDPIVLALQAKYRELARKVTTSKADEAQSRDEIAQHALGLIRSFVQNGDTASSSQMAIAANMQIPNVDSRGRYHGGNISIAQWALREALAWDRDNKASVIANLPELQSRHTLLEEMLLPENSSAAFVEVFDAVKIGSLVGEESAHLAGVTVGQFVRRFAASGEATRRSTKRAIEEMPGFKGRRNTENPPYTMAEVKAGEVKALRSVMHAVLEEGAKYINMDKDFRATGKLGEQSDRTHAQGLEAMRRVSAAFAEMVGVRKISKMTREGIQQVMQENPEWAEKMLDLIPNAMTNGVMTPVKDKSGRTQLLVAPWVYDMLTMEPEAGLMHYWRNIMLTSLNSKLASKRDTEELQFADLTDRIHQLMYRLDRDPDGTKYAKFKDELTSATSLPEFIQHLNREYLNDEAPYTAWVNDVADFSPHKSNGGWSNTTDGAALRTALADFNAASKKLVSTISTENRTIEADNVALVALRAGRRKLERAGGLKSVRTPNGVVSKEVPQRLANDTDVRAYMKWVRMFEMAKDRYVTLGPNAIQDEALGALLGFYAPGADKGRVPTHLKAIGAYVLQRTAKGFNTPSGQHSEALTASRMSSLRSNLRQVFDGGRTTLPDGTQVRWEPLTAESLLDRFDESHEMRRMVQNLMYPSVWDSVGEGQLIEGQLGGETLSSQLDYSYDDLIHRGGPESDRLYLSELGGISDRLGGDNEVLKQLNETLLVHSLGKNEEYSFDAAESDTSRAQTELAQILRIAGSLNASGADMNRLYDMVMQMVGRGKAVNVTGDAATDRGITESMVKILAGQEIATLQDLIRQETAKGENADITQIDMLTARMERAQAEMDGRLKQTTLLRQIQARHAYDSKASESDKALRRRQLFANARMRGLGLGTRVPDAMKYVARVNDFDTKKYPNGVPTLSDDAWDILGRAMMAYDIETLTNQSAGAVTLALFPKAGLTERHRYYDPSYSFLLDRILDPESPLLIAATRLAQRKGDTRSKHTLDELARKIQSTILDPERLGPWSHALPKALIDANPRLLSSPTEGATATGGLETPRQLTMSIATEQTDVVPYAELLSKTTLSFDQLWAGADADPFDVTIATSLGQGNFGTAQRKMRTVEFNGRFASGVKVSYKTTAGERVEVDVWTGVPMDPENPGAGTITHELGRQYHGALKNVSGSPYRMISVDQLKAAVYESIPSNDEMEPLDTVDRDSIQIEIEYFHPDSQPADAALYHNIFFEGTSHELNAALPPSLIAQFWFSASGNAMETLEHALGSGKKGYNAYEVKNLPTWEDTLRMEQGWEADLSEVLKQKAAHLTLVDPGPDAPLPIMFNSLLKKMKMQHYVRGLNENGDPELWSAERVIAAQARGEGISLQKPELVVLSEEAVNTMLGERGDHGLDPLGDTTVHLDTTDVRPYRGVTKAMTARLPGLLELDKDGNFVTQDIFDTELIYRRRRMPHSPGGTMQSKRVRTFEQFMVARRKDRDAEHDARTKDGARLKQQQSAWTERGLSMSQEAFDQMRMVFDWRFLDKQFTLHDTSHERVGEMMARELKNAVELSEYSTWWMFEYGSDESPASGVISELVLSTDATQRKALPPGSRPVLGDNVTILVDSFDKNGRTEEQQLDEAIKAVDYFMANGVRVVLASRDGSRELLNALAEHIGENAGYTRVGGSKYVYEPVSRLSSTQTQRALDSALAETHEISARHRIAVFLSETLATDENAMHLLGGMSDEVTVRVDLMPSEPFDNIVTPMLEKDVSRVKQAVTNLANDPARIREVAMQAGYKSDGQIKALTRQLKEVARQYAADPQYALARPNVGQRIEIGMPIPYFNPTTGDIVLYRHGHKPPRPHEVENWLREQRQKNPSTPGITVYGPSPMDEATVHTGVIQQYTDVSQYGVMAQVKIPLQTYFAKYVHERSGFKAVTSTAPTGWSRSKVPLFANWDLNAVAAYQPYIDKESFDDIVINHRNAFATLGIDFYPAVGRVLLNVDLEAMDGPERRMAEQRVAEVLTRITRTTGKLDDTVVARLLRFRSEAAAAGTEIFSAAGQIEDLNPTWVEDTFGGQPDPEIELTRMILLTLLTKNTRVEHLLRSGSFGNPDARTNPRRKSIKMKRIFTDALDTAASPELKQYINDRLNSQLGWNEARQEGLRLDLNFRLHRIVPGKPTEVGYLAFPEVHSADANPTTDAQAERRSQKQGHSIAVAALAKEALGADTVFSAHAKDFDGFWGSDRLLTFKDGKDVSKLFSSFASEKDSSYMPWKVPTLAGQSYMKMGRAQNSGYWKAVPLEGEGWGDDPATVESNQTRILSQRKRIANYLGLFENDHVMIDYLVRYVAGQPLNETGGHMTPDDVVAALDMIEENIEAGRLPTYDGAVPRIDYHLLQALFRAKEARRGRFKLREAGPDSAVMDKWGDWVTVALGENAGGEGDFHPMFRLDFDAVTHTYMNAENALSGLPISTDKLINEKLLDQKNDAVVLSISPDVQIALTERVYLDSRRVSFEEALGAEFFNGELRKKAPADGREHFRAAEWKAWQKRKGGRDIQRTSVKSFRERGVVQVNKKTALNTAMHIALNLRAGTTLMNPGLWVSAIGETIVRSSLDGMTEILMGNSTTRLGQLTNPATREEYNAIRAAISSLGSNDDFLSMAYQQTNYQQKVSPNAGWLERGTGKMAKAGSMMQDPAWRMRGDALAHRYMAAVLDYLHNSRTTNAVSLNMLAAKLKTDAHWVEKNLPEAHSMGIRAIENNRSLKQTPISMAINGFVNPMTESPNPFVSSTSTMFLKLPLMFSTYAANVFTTITGMQAPMTALAMALHRRKTPFGGRFTAFMRQEEVNPDDQYFDMTPVLESVDLSKAVIQGGLTHTAILSFALMAGAKGLSGEDEEDKRRRRAAEYQGAGYVYDPRKLQNDFRNADAIFLDNIPLLGALFQIPTGDGESTSMASPHWMVKQFLSPIMGIARFAETGDFREVMWGYQDALGAFPLINDGSWEKALLTYKELTAAAKDAEMRGTPADMSDAAYALIATTAAFESMLLENSFVNALYVGMDQYDRDPWKLPQTDGEGNIVRDELGQPQNTEALQSYLDENGEVKAGYVPRDWLDAQAHALSENRASFALMMSLFTGVTGQTNDYNRYNMAVKERSVDLQSVSQEEAMGLVLSVYDAETGNEVLTESGARAVFDGIWHRSVQLGDASLDGIYIPYEMRNNIKDQLIKELTAEALSQGMGEDAAAEYAWEIFNGSSTNPWATGMRDILYSDQIAQSPTAKYQQLNTTYVIGPDGLPWATGVRRGDFFTAFGQATGIPIGGGMKAPGLTDYYQGDVGNLDVDERLNSTDAVNGLNTGLRAVTRIDESWDIPTDEQIAEDIIDAIEEASKEIQAGGNNGYGSGYGSSGGGGSSYTRLYAPPETRAPYSNSVPYLNLDNPYVRRSSIRRERFTSQRGRLKQWQ